MLIVFQCDERIRDVIQRKCCSIEVFIHSQRSDIPLEEVGKEEVNIIKDKLNSTKNINQPITVAYQNDGLPIRNFQILFATVFFYGVSA